MAQEQTGRFHMHGGKSLTGVEEYKITKSAGGYLLQDRLQFQRKNGSIDLQLDQTADESGNLIRYTLQGTVSGQPQKVEAWVEGQQIWMEAGVGTEPPKRKSAELRPNTVLVDNLVVSHYQMLLDHIDLNSPPEQSWLLVPQALAVVPAKLTVSGEEAGRWNGTAVKVRKYTLGIGQQLKVDIWALKSNHSLMQVSVAMQNLEYVRDGFTLAVNSVVDDEVPADVFVERSLTFESGGVQIPATLCLPAKRAGKVPVIVLVHGSGPHDRDEKIGRNYPFRDLAHGLAQSGISTLRYDKRTFAFPLPSEMSSHPSLGTLDWEVTNDAVAALDYVSALPEASADIFVLGHSLGGIMAPYIAQRRPATRGIILIGAAGPPIDQIMEEQDRRALKSLGKSPQEIQKAVSMREQLFADIRSGKIPDDEIVNGAPASYWRDWMKRDVAAEIRKLRIPSLVLQGGKDLQVSRADYDELVTALKSEPPQMVEFHWFPNLNHLLMPETGQPSFDYSTAEHVAPQVIDVITSWVAKQVSTHK